MHHSSRAATNTNEPSSILATWITLEALSPQTYRRPEDLATGDRRCIVELTANYIPWIAGERSRPKKQLYYAIVLGSISMERATEDLIKAFGEDEERYQRVRERAAIGALLIDRNGILLEENGIAVSSFAWALPLALKLNLRSFGAWPTTEPEIIAELESIVRRVDRNGKAIPLDMPTIMTAYQWLVTKFGLPEHLVEPPTFAIRVYHYYKAKSPPEAFLLNSFFLKDLVRASELIGREDVPVGLRRYFGIEKPKKIFDLLVDKAALERAIAPAMMPAARWPAPGGYPLVLLQQAAVNIARAELAKDEGLVAVNGPPGTGKTTLLRDIVAAAVLDRALAMAAFDDPEKAFKPSGERISVGDKAFFHLYTLDQSLKGHEVLVTSSNNKAVENISKELPEIKAIGRRLDELTYFKSVSDVVYGQRQDREDEIESVDKIDFDPIETWGMIAAVLGNARNRAAFQKTFWWDEDHAFRLYLKAVKGDLMVQEIKDPQTGRIIERRTPAIITDENPPPSQSIKSNWHRARGRLISLKREIDNELAALEQVRELNLEFVSTRQTVSVEEASLSTLLSECSSFDKRRSSLEQEVQITKSNYEDCAARVHQHRLIRPSFFARLFWTKRFRAWSRENAPLLRAKIEAESLWKAAEKELSKATEALSVLRNKIRAAEETLANQRRQLSLMAQKIEQQRKILDGRLIDEKFFAQGHEATNLSVPWLPDNLHRKREDLFIAALAVHKAFIDASAQKMLHNLGALMDAFSSGRTQDENKRKLLGDLWSTLFLAVPVISTTFASVDRMLGDLPTGSIGWLLVDEAGQALPQAAVGAVMRAKRIVVVGDPLQISPIVTLPERLTAEVCKFFEIEKPTWAAPDASAQTLADQASQFQAMFRTDLGSRRAGIPLLVHRRCQEPMFGISNRIAYDSQMVHAPGPRDAGAIGRVLGPSAWLNIDGDADTKWCPAEGKLVASLLRKIAAADIFDPDIFIITPFRIVAQELRRQLEQEHQLFSSLRVDGREWINNRVGTIHTVQGREADTVMLVLGAPKASQNGARVWAAATPNILNVAVSRAKQNLYVIGSRGAWSGIGHARELANSMPNI